MLVKTKSIVLHTLKYSESSLIIQLYTEKHGRVSVIVKGVNSRKNRTEALSAYFRPLNLLDLELYYTQGKNLLKIKEVRFDFPYSGIPFNIRKSTIAIFLGEILKNTLHEEVQNPVLFTWLRTSLKILDQMESGYSDFHLAFLIKLSKYLGFAPGNNYSAENCYFDLREGLFTDRQPPHQDFLDKDQSYRFHHYQNTPLGSRANMKTDRKITRELLERVLGYYYIHLQGMPEIKSLKILNDIFAQP